MHSAWRAAWVGGVVLAATLASSPILLPAYGYAVRFLAGAFLSVSPPVDVASTADGSWRIFERLADGTEADLLEIPRSSVTELYVGVICLPALLMITPAPMRRRLRLLGWGVALLLLVQAVLLVVFVGAWRHYQRTDPDDALYTWLTLLHSAAGQLAVLPIWAGLTWQDWFQIRDGARLRAPRRRPARAS